MSKINKKNNNIPIPHCLRLCFKTIYTLKDFCETIDQQYSLSLFSSSSSSFSIELENLFKDTLIIFPKSNCLFGNSPRLPISIDEISLNQEESLTEILHKAIEQSLFLPSNTIQKKNIICYGFKKETDLSS